MSQHNQNGLDVIIEGGSKAEQYIVGALISKALNEAGYSNTEHHDTPGHVVDHVVQRAMYPSLLSVVKQNRPDFLNTPVIVSAYHAPIVPRERRAYDRVKVQALEKALSHRDEEDDNGTQWPGLVSEEKEDLVDA